MNFFLSKKESNFVVSIKCCTLNCQFFFRMAEAELLGEAKRAAIRHSTAGVAGWKPCPRANKFFLANTLLQTMASNRLLSKKRESKQQSVSKINKKKERKLLQSNKSGTNIIFRKPESIKTKNKYSGDKRSKNKKLLPDFKGSKIANNSFKNNLKTNQSSQQKINKKN